MEIVENNLENKKILVIDDHRNIRVTLRMTLEGEGAVVTEADTVQNGLLKLGKLDANTELPFDVILLDIRLPDGSGLDILKSISHVGHASRVIMISGEGTTTDAFKATQLGAFDYVEKPFTPERIIVSVNRCLEYFTINKDNQSLRKKLSKGQEILGHSDKILDLQKLIEKVAPTNGRVLIIGESGTGKELVSKEIYEKSRRKNKDYLKVNCAAIPETLIESELFGHEKGAFTGAAKTRKGLFERADGGTLFLDEIGELELGMQAKLLRVLQTGEMNRVGGEENIKVDVRIVAATNRDLTEMVENGTFREDLFYRLNVVTLFVPPLRERGDDVIILAKSFLEEACDEHSLGERTFTDSALAQLASYRWPGNIRELKNIVERVAILSETPEIDFIDEIIENKSISSDTEFSSQEKNMEQAASSATSTSGDLFRFATSKSPWQEFHEDAGRAYLKYILQHTNGNVSEAARVLCLERAYLHRLMKKLEVHRDVVVSG